MKRHDRRYLSTVKYRYKLSSDDYYALFEVQQGRCAICQVHQDDMGERLAVDHDHATGAVRGLLCRPCNQSLGMHERRGTSAWYSYRVWPPMRELQYRRESAAEDRVG